MGVDGKLNPRNVRRAETAIGRPLAMAFVLHPWVIAVTPADEDGAHEHWLWSRTTGEVARDDEPVHWTTCPGAQRIAEETNDG